jgi:hypothetical protein
MMAPALSESAQAAKGRVRTTLRAPSIDSVPHSPTLSAVSDATSIASLHQPDARVRTSLPIFSLLSERTLAITSLPFAKHRNKTSRSSGRSPAFRRYAATPDLPALRCHSMAHGIKKDLHRRPPKRPTASGKSPRDGRRYGAFRFSLVDSTGLGPAPGLRVHLLGPAVRAVRAVRASVRARPRSLRALALRQARPPREADCSGCTPTAAPSRPTGPMPQKDLFS